MLSSLAFTLLPDMGIAPFQRRIVLLDKPSRQAKPSRPATPSVSRELALSASEAVRRLTCCSVLDYAHRH
jgi:hypothetical protein